MSRTPQRDALSTRLHSALAAEESRELKNMFGAVCFLVRGKIVVCANGDGSMLVRVDERDHDALTEVEGVETATMGERSMESGWITVHESTIADDAHLTQWVRRALDYNRRATA